MIETRTYPTAVVLSLASGRLMCDFGDMHAFAEFVVGSPVFTHQFAHEPFVDELKSALYRQHPKLRDFDEATVTRENWQAKRDAAIAVLGNTLAIHPMGEPEHFAEAFTAPLAGKNVVVV